MSKSEFLFLVIHHWSTYYLYCKELSLTTFYCFEFHKYAYLYMYITPIYHTSNWVSPHVGNNTVVRLDSSCWYKTGWGIPKSTACREYNWTPRTCFVPRRLRMSLIWTKIGCIFLAAGPKRKYMWKLCTLHESKVWLNRKNIHIFLLIRKGDMSRPLVRVVPLTPALRHELLSRYSTLVPCYEDDILSVRLKLLS